MSDDYEVACHELGHCYLDYYLHGARQVEIIREPGCWRVKTDVLDRLPMASDSVLVPRTLCSGMVSGVVGEAVARCGSAGAAVAAVARAWRLRALWTPLGQSDRELYEVLVERLPPLARYARQDSLTLAAPLNRWFQDQGRSRLLRFGRVLNRMDAGEVLRFDVERLPQ